MNIWNLISEDEGNKISLGRLSFWLIFALCWYFWLFLPVTVFPDSLFYTLAFLMAYNVSKKSLRVLDGVLNVWMQKKFGGNVGMFAGGMMRDSMRDPYGQMGGMGGGYDMFGQDMGGYGGGYGGYQPRSRRRPGANVRRRTGASPTPFEEDNHDW